MMPRVLAAWMAALLLVFTCPAAVFAQSDSGQIRIIVNDATGKTPVELARVLLDGPVITSELSGKNGQVLFTDAPDGIYRARVAKNGYQLVTSPPFEVVNGRAVTVNVSLALATQEKIIATVVAHSSVSVSSSSISADSAQRKLSDDLAGALNKLSGVSVSTSSDDSDAMQTVSLEGHDASQTQLTLDGIPLNAPGSAGDLRSFATDLFSGASVHMGPQVGGLGGGVNFSTLQPTISWLSNLTMSTGSNGKYNYSFAESGSLGKLGVAFEHTYRLNSSLVDGMRYLDASGIDYVHDGDSSIDGNLARLRYQFSDSQTLTGTFLNSDRSTNLVCLRFAGAVPCGYGPGNTSDGSVQLYSLTDNALIGETQVQASLFSSDNKMLLDELNRYVDGAAQPNGFSTDMRNSGYSVNATLPSRERHTISIQAYGNTSTQATTPLVTQANPYYNNAQQSSYAALQVTDSVHANDRLALSESIGLSHASNAPSTVLATIGASWKPTANDGFNASYSIGGVAASPGRFGVLTDPASLHFDCNGNAYGNAPGDEPGASSSTSARLAYTRSFKRGSFSVSLYRQTQSGVLLPVQVNGSALSLPGGYFALAQADYQATCGASAPPLAVTGLYFSSPIGGVQRIYEGGSLTGFLTLGNLVLQPYYNVNVSKAISNDPRIANPYSITISGEQLPNVPLQRAGLVADYKAPRSHLEWMADAQYVAKNNPNNLPAYTTFDAGVSAQLTTGTLTFAASNITNAYGGTFASPENAVPYQTQAGTLIPTIARPLTPRSYSVTYSVKFGPGAAGNTQTGAQFPTPRGGGMRAMLAPLPPSPPSNPLDVTTSNPMCTSANAAAAQNLSGELKGYVAQVEAMKTAAGYPATLAPGAFDDATVTYHGLGTTYALTIVPKFNANATGAARQGGVRAFLGCLPLHLAHQDDVTARHLYATTTAVMFAPQIAFMPSVGLYIVARAQTAGRETFRVYALPTAPPSDPFVVHSTSETCSADLHSAAAQALEQVQAYFSNGAKPSLWTIKPHQSGGGTWYELVPADPSVIGSLLMCGHVAAANHDELVKRGFDGATPPSLNYAKPLGIYVLRPQRPPGAP